MSSPGSTVLTEAPVGGGPPPADTQIADPWFKTSGIDAAHHPYIENKGWKGAGDMLESYVNMEKLVGLERGGQADRILVIPKAPVANALPADIEKYNKDVADFVAKSLPVSVPTDAKGYNLNIPKDLSNPIFKDAGDIFKEAGVPGNVAQKLFDVVVARDKAAVDGLQAKITAEEKELQALPDFAQNKELGRRAIAAAGLTEEEAAYIGGILGPKRALEAFAKLGASFREAGAPPIGDGKGGHTPGFTMSKESAAAEALKLRKDPAFQADYLSPNPMVRKGAIERIEALDKRASGG